MIDWLKAGLPAGVPRETRPLFTVKKFANSTAYVKALLPSASMQPRPGIKKAFKNIGPPE
jgi:hypothetical protein